MAMFYSYASLLESNIGNMIRLGASNKDGMNINQNREVMGLNQPYKGYFRWFLSPRMAQGVYFSVSGVGELLQN